MDASDITRTPQSSGAMSPAAAIAAAFAAAAAHQQQDAAVTPNYQAASATPWGAQIATPRNFQGRAVAVTKTQVAAKTQGAAQQVAGASFNPLTGDAGLSSAGAAGLSSAGTAALSSARAPRTTPDWGGAPQIEMTAQDPAANGGSGVDLIFDEEAQRQDETLRQRNEALVSNVIALQQGSLTSFSLVEEGMTMVKVEPSTILEEEQDYIAGESEEDFIAGNVSELRSTGTDNGSALSTGAALASDGSIAGTVSDVEVEEVPIIPARLHVSSTLNLPNAGADRSPCAHLLPSLLSDFVHCWYAYGAALLLCVLCLLNVYQVQATNTVNARLNEVSLSNESIEREWLNLMAQRQNLSEHATVRDSAIYQLQMVAPQTEKEHVIYLKKK
ncbi:MAG: cell division protein FtsL [Anaerobiospirillum sp.]|nr:cell division protein FtsL [Anaerobiospirillum sp.]